LLGMTRCNRYILSALQLTVYAGPHTFIVELMGFIARWQVAIFPHCFMNSCEENDRVVLLKYINRIYTCFIVITFRAYAICTPACHFGICSINYYFFLPKILLA
jgi:hypothetical protein